MKFGADIIVKLNQGRRGGRTEDQGRVLEDGLRQVKKSLTSKKIKKK